VLTTALAVLFISCQTPMYVYAPFIKLKMTILTMMTEIPFYQPMAKMTHTPLQL